MIDGNRVLPFIKPYVGIWANLMMIRPLTDLKGYSGQSSQHGFLFGFKKNLSAAISLLKFLGIKLSKSFPYATVQGFQGIERFIS